ncbi:MAG: ribonuclease HIII [Candidatus Auribacterota bacterium]|jgi:ribonuclease HIII|uniref:Ribonuclease HIII n=1 Tax=Candidatus Auribacter fodinae TaxID=2093366 RepID=A0A3A4QZQ1_9BACT|nr:MAG: ribonuclease HIII [Candidatus Auribacter fodinae]
MKAAELAKLKEITTYTVQLSPPQYPQLRKDLEEHGFVLKKTPYAFFSALKDSEKINVTLYKSGKLVLQGKGTAEFIQYYLEPVLLRQINYGYEDIINDLESHDARIGVDESGKGDYFGPLIIAGVYITPKVEKTLRKLGVKDSKNISDKKIRVLREKIIELCPFSVVVIGPERYNDLYDRIGNLNRLLAWGHARVIENLLTKVDCDKVIIDKFGNNKYILDSLMKRGKKIPIVQKVRAEVDCAVAAASVLARGEFLRRLAKLSKELEIKLPKGANDKVETTAKELISQQGIDSLKKAAKMHFKTTRKIFMDL